MKNTWIKKGLVLGIIFLFIGTILTQTINANIYYNNENDLVEFKTEIYGLIEKKEYSIELTKTEAKEVENLLKNIENKIKNIETEDEINIIFNKAISELYSYGLFGKIKIDEIKNIFKCNFLTQNLHKNHNFKPLNDSENRFCLIAGNVKWAVFLGFIPRLCYTLANFSKSPLIFNLLVNIAIRFALLDINFPFYFFLLSLIDIYDEGWVWTFGLNGVKSWEGVLQGQMGGEPYAHFGVAGFTGIKISGQYPHELFFGFANYVNIEEIV